MPLLLLVRHAPTAWNEAGRIQGHTDIPVSQAGLAAAQAWRLPPETADWPVYSSPLGRCQQTAHLLGRQVRVEPSLIEMDWGQWEGQSLADLRAALGPAMQAMEDLGLDFCPPGGESPRQVQRRLSAFLANLQQDSIAITHKGVLRALVAWATDWPMLGRAPSKFRDGHAHLLRITGGKPTLERLDISLQRDGPLQSDGKN